MLGSKHLGIFGLVILLIHIVSSQDKTSKEWTVSAQKIIWETSQVFHRATIGLSSFNKTTSPKLVKLSSMTAKLAGVFGVFGALFSIIMQLIPGSKQDSPELKYMKDEFGKLSQKVDTIAKSIDEAKDLIKIQTQKAAYAGYEQNIHQGFSQMEICQKSLGSVKCSNQTDCKRKKLAIVEGYINSMKVRQDVDTILRGVTTDSVFGSSMMYLMKANSKCNVPKIDLFTNKIIALITKGIIVSMFYDQVTKTDYNPLEEEVVVQKMFSLLEKKRQEIQHSCLKRINYWMSLDIKHAQETFSSDTKNTNLDFVKMFKGKYPWIDWHILSYKGTKAPIVGPKGSPYQNFVSSSKTQNMHGFVIPTNKAKIENTEEMIKEWKNIIKTITISGDTSSVVKSIETQIEDNIALKHQVEAFAVLPGENWVLGHFKTEIRQKTLGFSEETSANVFVSQPRSGFIVVVLFKQAEYPPKCTKQCYGKDSKCFLFPYSLQMGCRCQLGYSGENCQSSGMSVELKSAINALLQSTMKLPTFSSMSHLIEDTRLYLTTSTENIQNTIATLGARIDKQFKSLGEFMSNKFDWFAVLLKYKDAIENLNYFHSISSKKVSKFQEKLNISTITSGAKGSGFSLNEEKDIARFLLSPAGIQKWLYQINFLIVGRRDSQFNSHKPIIAMVMDKYKNSLCSKGYKDEITRTYRQLMLLQLQGYFLWSRAYSIVNHDIQVISNRYNDILERQKKYLQGATCSLAIPHSTNLASCAGGYFIHRSMDFTVACEDGYFLKESPRHLATASQWVDKIIAKSSEYCRERMNAQQVVGPSDVSKYGITSKAWYQGQNRSYKEEFLHVKFEKKLIPKAIEVYESYNAGAVKRIQVFHDVGKWQTVWETDTLQQLKQLRTFSPTLKVVSFETDQVKIFLDPSVAKGFVGIDAIKLTGKVVPQDICKPRTSFECSPCNCNTQGSISNKCDSKGKCTCNAKFYGEKCNERNCEMNAWTSWNRNCRCGYSDVRYRTRSVRVQPLGKGVKCPSTTRESHTCPMVACDCRAMGKPTHYGPRCDKRDCVLNNWAGWSNTCDCSSQRCSSSPCPTLSPTKTRTRSIKTHAEGGGRACSTVRSDTDYCGHRCVWYCFRSGRSSSSCSYRPG